MSGFSVGMRDGEAIELTISAPVGVNFVVTPPSLISVEFDRPNGKLTLTSWVQSNITTSQLTATYVQSGADKFPQAGPMKIRTAITVGGAVYRMKTVTDEITQEPQ